MDMSVFIQSRIDTPTFVTVTVPAEVQVVQGTLIWNMNLRANQTLTRTVTINTQLINSVTGIRVDVSGVENGSIFGKTELLYVRRNTVGGIETSHDPLFGAPYCCVGSDPGVGVITATPGEVAITTTPNPVKPPTPFETPLPVITKVASATVSSGSVTQTEVATSAP
jgi:hypothetical protein